MDVPHLIRDFSTQWLGLFRFSNGSFLVEIKEEFPKFNV